MERRQTGLNICITLSRKAQRAKDKEQGELLADTVLWARASACLVAFAVILGTAIAHRIETGRPLWLEVLLGRLCLRTVSRRLACAHRRPGDVLPPALCCARVAPSTYVRPHIAAPAMSCQPQHCGWVTEVAEELARE